MSTVSIHPQRLRRIAGVGSLVVAAVYGLIATDVINVLDDQATASPGPPMVAAGAFTVLGLLLLLTARRGVLLFGAVLQAVSVAMYLLVASRRVPAFEGWGLGLKVAQLILLGVFVWLLRSTRDDAGTAHAAGSASSTSVMSASS